MKTCSKCGVEKSLDSFYKDGTGLRSECKACTLLIRNAYYVAHKDSVLAYQKRVYVEHNIAGLRLAAELGAPGAEVRRCERCQKMKPITAFLARDPVICRKCVGNTYQRNPEKRIVSAQRYEKTHREERRAAGQAYRFAHLEVCQQRDRIRRPEKREYERSYYASHPEKRALRNAQYHKRARDAAGSCTEEQLKARFAFYGNCCAYCGGKAETADHVIPLSRGGSNFPANFRPACRSCNSSKSDRKLSEWKFNAVFKKESVNGVRASRPRQEEGHLQVRQKAQREAGVLEASASQEAPSVAPVIHINLAA